MFWQLAYLDRYLRPLLAKVLPPSFFVKIYTKNRDRFLESLTKRLDNSVPITKKPTEIAGLNFRNDLGNAAGLDKDGKLLEFNYKLGAGFAIVGTVLCKPHTGNIVRYGNKDYNPWSPLPFSNSAMNSLGLPSKGIDAVLDAIKLFQDNYQPSNFPIGLSIMGHPNQEGGKKVQGVLECVQKAQKVVNFIEVNESCPNVTNNTDIDDFQKRIKAISTVGKIPIFVKFATLNFDDFILEELDKLNFAGVSLCNTQKDYPLFREKLHPKDLKIYDFYKEKFAGGLSGQAIREYSQTLLQKTHDYLTRKNLNLHLIHIGGISQYQHIEASRKYAPLRQWYTGLMEAIVSKPLNKVYSDVLK